MSVIVISFILLVLPPGMVNGDNRADNGISTEERELLHWLLNEAAQEAKVEPTLSFISNNINERYIYYLNPYLDFYNKDYSEEKFFDKVVLDNGYEYLFLVYLEEWSEDQIDDFVSKHGLSNRVSHLKDAYQEDNLDRIEFKSGDLNIGLLLLDSPKVHHEIVDEFLNLYNNWKNDASNYSSIENAFITHYYIRVFYNNNKLDYITEIYNLGYAQNVPHIDYILGSYSFLYNSLRNQGSYEELLRLIREELLSYIGENKFGSIRREFDIYLNYTLGLHRIGNITKAFDALNQIEHYVENEEITPHHYFAYVNNRSVLYHELGRYSDYIDLQLEALEHARELGIDGAKVHSLNNIYRFYRSTEDWQQAEQYLVEAMNIVEEGPPEELADVNISMAIYQKDYVHDYAKAEEYFEKALSFANESGDFNTVIRAKTEWANFLIEQGQYQQASELHYEVLTDSEEAGSERSMLDAMAMYADVQLDLGNIAEARNFLNELEEYNLSEYDFRLQLRAVTTRARYHLKNNELKTAVAFFQPYIQETLDRVQNSSDYQTGRASLISVFEEAFRLYARVLSEKGAGSQLLSFLDRFNNLSQADFHNHHLLKSEMLSEDELIYDQELTQHIDQLRDQIRRADDSDERARLNEMLLEAENEKNRLRHKIHDQQQFESPDITRIRRSLGRDEMVLKYSMIANTMYVHAIYRDKIEGQVVEMEDTEIQEIESFIEAMKSGDTDLEFLYALQNKFIEPEWLVDIERVEVIPDHFMHYIPHEIIPVTEPSHKQAYGSTRYLIEDVTINYRHSLTELSQPGSDSRTGNREILAMGVTRTKEGTSVLESGSTLPSLPFAAVEVNNIRQIYENHQSCRVFVDEEVNFSNFKAYAPQSQVMHLATHSEVSPHDPLFSVIYLGGDDPDNQSHIHAYELFEMNLQNELVVLSSCESGAGAYVRGGGIAGLNRAFRFAGAQSMAMNLWPVRDETAARLNTQFYRNLHEGNPKDKALREAKLYYLNNRNSDPFWWGAMMMYGDPSPLHEDTGSRTAALTLLIAWFASITVIMVMKMYRKS